MRKKIPKQFLTFATVSIYQIDETNVLCPDPNFGSNRNNANALLTVGAIRNRGFDLDINSAITRRWNVSFNHSHIDSRITKDNVASLFGKPLANVSPNTIGIFDALRFDALGGFQRRIR